MPFVEMEVDLPLSPPWRTSDAGTRPSASRCEESEGTNDGMHVILEEAAHHTFVEVLDHAVRKDHIISYDQVPSTRWSLNLLQEGKGHLQSRSSDAVQEPAILESSSSSHAPLKAHYPEMLQVPDTFLTHTYQAFSCWQVSALAAMLAQP